MVYDSSCQTHVELIEMYTVKNLANLAGVTPRTLHHYDQIGLLHPSHKGDNGYRYYDEAAVLRLQQILFFRELGLGLDEIASALNRPDFDLLTALEEHRTGLSERVERLERLIQTVDKTISHLKGQSIMTEKQLFAGFSEEKQKQYEEEALQMYDSDTVRASMKRWKNYTPEEKARIGQEGEAVYRDLLKVMDKGPSALEVQACIARWHRHLEYFWSPNDEQLLGLGDLYTTHPGFIETYENIQPGLANFMKEAITVYVNSRKAQKSR